MAPLARGERREFDVTVTTTLRTLAGWVRARSGTPVEGATVSIVNPEREFSSSGTEADSEGSFRLEGIAASTITLQVFAKGFAPLVLHDWPVPEDPVELLLDVGNTVTVRVVGPDEMPVPTFDLTARVPGSSKTLRSKKVEPGLYSLENLPDEEVNLKVRVGGRTFERLHNPRDPEARFDVPASSPLLVRLEGLPEEKRGDQLFLVLKSGELEVKSRQTRWIGGETSEVSFDTVFFGRYEAFILVSWDQDKEPIGEPLVFDLIQDGPNEFVLRL